MIKAIVNGENISYGEKISIAELLNNFALDSKKIAVERNLSIVKRGEFGSVFIEDGDIIEIIEFVGGG